MPARAANWNNWNLNDMAYLEINRVHFPVTTLGPGRRLGIWVQGCSLGCPGCVSKDTWRHDPARGIAVDALIDGCASWIAEADGITLTGGEPLEQAEGIAALLNAVARWQASRPTGHRQDVLLFTGYQLGELAAKQLAVLHQVDAVVTGRYRPEAGQSLVLRGSDNQRLLALSVLGLERYKQLSTAEHEAGTRPLNLTESDRATYMTGLPRPADLPRLTALLHQKGYAASSSSSSSAYD